MQSEMSDCFRLRAGYRLPSRPEGTGKHAGILTHFQTKVNKKNGQKSIFSAILYYIEIRTLSRIICKEKIESFV